jgi:hypothetical protein
MVRLLPRHGWARYLLAASCVAVVGWGLGAASLRAQTRDPRFALLVGISDYPGDEHDLAGGPLNDVMLMRNLLVNTLGFPEENVLTVTDRDGTRANIERAFRTHLRLAGKAGVAVFYFSGHGTQVPNDNDDAEADGLDEAIVTRGSAPEAFALMRDDALGSLVGSLGVDRVLVLLDNCFSGTGTRGASRQVRWRDIAGGLAVPGALQPARRVAGRRPIAKRIPKDVVARLPSDPAGPMTETAAGSATGPMTHILISASAEDEISLNVPLVMDDGSEFAVGLLTAALYSELHNVDLRRTTFIDLASGLRRTARGVAARLQESPQTPQLEGARQGMTIGAYLAAP